MSYATLDELLDALGISDYDDQADMQRALDAASAWIEHHCERTFTVGASETRYYYTTSVTLLDVEDLQTVTSIAIDSSGDRTYATTFDADDYELLPLDGPPYQQVKIWPTSSRSFSPGRRVKIVGTFGYSPTASESAALKQACILLATRWFKRHEAPFGILGATDLGTFERISKNDPDVLSLLEPLKRTGASGSWIAV